MKKILKKSIIVSLFIIMYIYALVITNLPDTLIVFEGENVAFNTIFGIDIKLKNNQYEAMLTSSNVGKASFNQEGTVTLTASLFDFNIKDIDVNVIDKTTVIPVGELVGIKLYTKGVLVVGMAEIEGQKPYSGTEIQE